MQPKEPMYLVIQNEIIQKIRSGALRAGDRLPTEGELAAQYGVSRVTSQRAMRELKQKGTIVRKPRRGTYVAHFPDVGIDRKDILPSGRLPLASNGFTHIAVVAPFDMTTPGIYQYLDGIISASDEQREKLHLYNTHYMEGMDGPALEQCVADSMDGIIYYPGIGPELPFELLIRLKTQRVPLVLIDKRLDCLGIPSVQTENRIAMHNLVQRMLAVGHRKFAYASEIRIVTTPSVRERYLGFCETLATAGATHVFARFPSELEKPGEQTKEKRFKAIKDALQAWEAEGITAIACDSDLLALDLLDAHHAEHPDTPFHFSLTGFDGMNPQRVSTARQRYMDIGYQAMKLLHSQLYNGDFSDKDVRIEVDYLDGGTIRPAG